MKYKAFTLIELLLAMAIMGILAVMLIGNFNSTIKRGRDAQRKNDMSQLQKALEVYYEDNNKYPIGWINNDIFGKKLCTTNACGATETVYMIKTPNDPNTSFTYRYEPNATGSQYYIYSYIENNLDQGNAISITGYSTNEKCDMAKATTNCRYYVGSSNAPVLTPNP